MGFLELIDKLINERGSAAILERQLAFVREQAEVIVNKVAQLEQEKATAEQRLAQLEAELKAYRDAEQFVEHEGALFQRKPEGGYSLLPRCPNCRAPMVSGFSGVPYSCATCHYRAPFDQDNLPQIIAKLPT